MGAVFGEFAPVGEGKDLIPAGVGEDRAGPLHERVKPAGLFEDFGAGPEVEVVRIAEDDLRPDVRHEFARRNGLHRADGAHGHEDGRLDGAVRGLDQSRAGRGVCVLKGEAHTDRILEENAKNLRPMIQDP